MIAVPATSPPRVAIAVAPNGPRLTRADHPGLPMTPDELARTAASCLEAGAAMLHLHVRDAAGRHVLDAGRFRDATAAVRAAVGQHMVIQVTTEAVGLYRPDQQMALVRELRPEAISAALRELVPDAAAEREAAIFYDWCVRQGIAVQHILYDGQDAIRLADLLRRGIIPDDRPSVLFVLGRYRQGGQSEPRDLAPFLVVADPRWIWMMCAFGRHEHDCAVAAALNGGHARIGFENNRQTRTGAVASDNAGQVRDLAASLRALGREPACADEIRGWRG